jgi:hypothetical protein
MRTLKALCAVAALSTTAIVALSLSAEARCAYGGCKGPIVGTKVNTSYHYNTVHRAENVTRSRDIYRPHPVVNINRIVTVTRVQPVIHENRITRVHNRTEALYETQHSARREMLPARSVMYGKTIQMGGYMPAPRVNTVYRYNTVAKVQNVTRYNDVEHTQYVRHINRIVNVTRVQPVIYTNVVTRIHDRPVYSVRNEYLHETRMLPARTVVTSKVVQMNYRPTRMQHEAYGHAE